MLNLKTNLHLKSVLLFSTILILLMSGCELSPEQLVLSHPSVKEFLKEYPNSEVKVTFFSQSEVQNMIELIQHECDNPYLEPKDYYRVTITDKTEGLSVLAWLEWETRVIKCVVKKPLGSENLKIKEYVKERDQEEGEPIPVDEIDEMEEGQEEKEKEEMEKEKSKCPSCDDNNNCTFDYCNEFTEFECKHLEVIPCYNNGVCEYEETDLPSDPSCPDPLGIFSGKVTYGVPAETKANRGYHEYRAKINSGKNNDCPETCDDGDPATSDYFNFGSQKCGHYACVKDTTPPIITILEPEKDSILINDSITFRMKTDEDAVCWHILDAEEPSEKVDMDANTEYSFALTALNEGIHILYAHCIDASGNTAEKNVQFEIDLNPPSISIIALNGAVITDSSTLLYVTTSLPSICEYELHVSSETFSGELISQQMDETDDTQHFHQLDLPYDNSTYTVYVTCKYLSYVNTASAMFQTNSSAEELIYYPTI